MKTLLFALVTVFFSSTLFATNFNATTNNTTESTNIVTVDGETDPTMKPISNVKIEEYINLHADHSTFKVVHKEGTDAIFVKWPQVIEDLQVTLYNYDAKKLSNEVVNKKNITQVEISDLAAGEYYLVVKSKNTRAHITYMVEINR